MVQRRRKPGVKGRTDLGVEAGKTGAYTHRTKNDDGPDTVVDVYRLRGITDGFVRDFVDDGATSEGTPMNGRQTLVNALKKEFIAYDGDDEIPHPMFFLDERVARGYDRINGFPVPVADKQCRAVMLANVADRDKSRAAQLSTWEKQKEQALSESIRIDDAVRKPAGAE
jgi:hypothetical protein